MITIILEDKADTILARISQEGNDSYLVWEVDDPAYKLLSLIDNYSYTCFAPEDMPQVIVELKKLKSTLSPKESEHVSEIISLANRCLTELNTTLTFTVFDEKQKNVKGVSDEWHCRGFEFDWHLTVRNGGSRRSAQTGGVAIRSLQTATRLERFRFIRTSTVGQAERWHTETLPCLWDRILSCD